MKNSIEHIFRVRIYRAALFSLILTGQITAARAVPANIEAKVEHIENGILSPVLIKGRPAPRVRLADRMAALHVPGVSVAVIHNGKIEWARGFGVARVGGAPVTPDTIFQAGSISKPVAALAVLHLVQSGKLDLDTDVNQYLKSWKIPDNNFTEHKKVTLRELLTHTAGMTVHGFGGYMRDTPVPTLKQVLDGEPPANSPAIRVDTTPGTIWRYSGGGYVVMQQMLDDVTGKAFPELMHDSVLGPIGMTHSTYEQPLPASRLAEAAMPYDQNASPIAGGPHTYPEMAPAGLWTTPSDLARYAIEVQKSLAGKSNRVLSRAMTAQMLKPGGLGGWGLGPQLGGGVQHPYFEHSGVDEGFISNLVAYNNGDGVVIMTNSYNGGILGLEILRTVAHEYGWLDFQPIEHAVATVSPTVVNGYIGSYQRGRYSVTTITRDGDKVFSKQTGQEPKQIFPVDNRNWFFLDSENQLTFDVDSQGQATALISHQNGVDSPAKRIGDAEAKQIADALAVKLQSQAQDPGTEAALRRNIDELRRGSPNYDLMSPGLANVTRQQLSDLKATINGLGPLTSVSFKGVGPRGEDIYDVKFSNGATRWTIILAADGTSETIGVQIVP